MDIWVELVVLLNFLVDFLLILGTNRLSGFPTDWKRVVLAAVFGGVYGGVCLIPDFRFLGNPLWRLVSLGLMGILAFGCNRNTLRRCGVFTMLSLALGGMASGMSRSDLPVLMLCAGLLWLLCCVAFPDGTGNRTCVPLEIRYGDACVQLTALRDTGNTLRDPVSGEQVLVICADAASKLTGLTREQLCRPVEAVSRGDVPGLRLIPYKSVGSRGLLLAKRFENVRIGTRRQEAVIAFDTGNLGKMEGYQALAGGSI